MADRSDAGSTAQVASLEAENARLRKLEALTKEGRHAFNDQNEAGKTIVDFLNCWLDQEKARAETAERQLAEARRVLKHDQWAIIDRAIERYSAGEISDLHALGLVTNGFLALDQARAAIAPAEKPASDGPDTDYDPSRDM